MYVLAGSGQATNQCERIMDGVQDRVQANCNALHDLADRLQRVADRFDGGTPVESGDNEKEVEPRSVPDRLHLQLQHMESAGGRADAAMRRLEGI